VVAMMFPLPTNYDGDNLISCQFVGLTEWELEFWSAKWNAVLVYQGTS
jgi:hypothetical protein